MSGPATLAVVLARGLGSRMRRADADAALTPAQQAAADRGQKAMMPIGHGRPLLDYILDALANAGIREVCLVVAPDHQAMVGHFAAHPPRRLTVSFAVQPEPTGTADAVLAAEPWVAGREFLVLNADNLYPVEALRALVELDGPGLIVFDREALIRESNIPAERVRSFALPDVDDRGMLRHLVEKPTAEEFATMGGGARGVSMNLWRFGPSIFAACRDVPVSSRGERELPQAVALAAASGMPLRAHPISAGVLDLSGRGDIEEVSRRLAGRHPDP